ncbi:hypothetical protein E4P29_18650 [Rhodococcus sp. 1R11]|uniref:hypothetical protein n=1 Tax=Rhodococcus sp. 1R11 TaxID=2559614 RepID=UPI0010721499|nr:hypothetical protein [Rhodococcus sp. 1R11]TFI42070.1 hypothetical protein E4P29_18650 [Rhodococcus sp. 1R11]
MMTDESPTLICIDAMQESMEQLNAMFKARGIHDVRFTPLPEPRSKVRWAITAATSKGHVYGYTGEAVPEAQEKSEHDVAILLSVIEVARMLGYEIDLVSAPT